MFSMILYMLKKLYVEPSISYFFEKVFFGSCRHYHSFRCQCTVLIALSHTFCLSSLFTTGFESPDRPEAFRSFLALLAGASSRYSDTIGKLGNATAAAKYRKMADDLTSRIRGGSDWHAAWGMHASADAINAGIVQPSEVAAMLDEDKGVFGDPLQVHCCLRPFSSSIFSSLFFLTCL